MPWLGTNCGLLVDSCNCSRISTPSMPIQETIEPVGKGSQEDAVYLID